MKFKKINQDSKEFKEIWKIYEYSFPKDERRTLEKQTQTFKKTEYKLFAVYEAELIGFIAIWEFEEFRFIEHIAIKKEQRNKGLGTKLMKEFLDSKIVVLEVERPNTEIDKRRIEFYKRLGFKLNTYDYIQPPYEEGKNPVPLYLMTHPKEITEQEFSKMKEKLFKTVYEQKKLMHKNTTLKHSIHK